jgi:hypothetical protein
MAIRFWTKADSQCRLEYFDRALVVAGELLPGCEVGEGVAFAQSAAGVAVGAD